MPRIRLNTRAATSRKESRSATLFGFSKGSGGFNDPRPPVITLVSSGTPGATTATITWTTDRVSDSQVFWGLTTVYTGATSPVMNFTMVTSHSVGLTGLVTATTYHYKVLSRTPDGGYTFSADGTFLTA